MLKMLSSLTSRFWGFGREKKEPENVLSPQGDQSSGKEQELNPKEQELIGKELELKAKELELNVKELKLSGKEQELNGKKQELNVKEQKMKGKELELNSKKQELNAKEQELNGKKLELSCKKLNQNNESSLRQGIITFLTNTSGVIDCRTFFHSKAADNSFQTLTIGCKVEYLISRQNGVDVPTVVQVHRIPGGVCEVPPFDKIQDALQKLRIERPSLFNTQTRNVIGIVTISTAIAIMVRTDRGQFRVELEAVKIPFEPRLGDRVLLMCKVCRDDEFQHEILQVVKVQPERIVRNQKCVVGHPFEDGFTLGKRIYVLNLDVASSGNLESGDVVRADLIDCQYLKFTQRAIKLTQMTTNFGEVQPTLTLGECQSVSLIGNSYLITTTLNKWCHMSLKVYNNAKHALLLDGVTVPEEGDPQLIVILPSGPVDIPVQGETSLIFRVYAESTGETSKNFQMNFGDFKISHSLAIIVCETKAEALNAKRRMIAAVVPTSNARKPLQEYRSNANKVWSRSEEVVPGESIGIRRRFVAMRLGAFEVPDKLRRIYLTTERQGAMYKAIETEYPFVRECLNIDNYAEVFSLFLHLEEIENYVLIRNYDRDRAHFHRHGEYLSLQIENLIERRPSLVIGDVVHAIKTSADNSNTIFEGIIHRVLPRQLLLKFNSTFHEGYNGEEYRLEFHFSRFNLRKQHHAISQIAERMGEDFLFPTKVTKRLVPQLEVKMVNQDIMYLYDTELKWFNPFLNPIQKRAVFNIMRGDTLNMPYVIFGPPGTGKTMTLVEAILQVVDKVSGAQILVGTPSNSSADMVTRKIVESNVLRQGEFVRLVSFNQIDRDLIPADLQVHCATVDIAATGSCPNSMVVTESGMKMRCPKTFIERHRITISTNSTLGNFLQMDFAENHFTHVFIDEAGQCTEPETMVPISMLHKDECQVVLAGDPRQLQAIVVNRFSSHSGYANSFLERLLDLPPYKKHLHKFPNSSGYNPLCLTKLLNNYRSLQTIMCTYSTLFYEDELISMVSDTDSREMQVLQRALKVFQPAKEMPPQQAAFFFGIDGQNMQDNDSTSWYNPQEAKQIYLTTVALYGVKFRPEQIGILTPYAKQVKLIKNLFQSNKLDAPKIGSVEEFQGQERDIMLISLVRSSLSLGFVKSSKRMNVSISRARAMMVVFGNPKILAMDDLWRRYITYCCHNYATFGCELPDSIVCTRDTEQEVKKYYS